MSRLRVISWNLLNDIHASKHGSQEDRFKYIADTIKNQVVDYPVAIFMFEVTDPNRFKQLAKELGFKYYDSVKYSDDWNGFVASHKPKNFKTIHHDGSKLKYNKDKSIMIDLKGVKISSTHMPHYILADETTRYNFSKDIINADPDICTGDFNATYINPSRLIFKAKGYKNAWPTQKPRDTFPSPSFRGKNLPLYLPNARIDAHYYKGVSLVNHTAKNTPYSDHPILVSDFEIKS